PSVMRSPRRWGDSGSARQARPEVDPSTTRAEEAVCARPSAAKEEQAAALSGSGTSSVAVGHVVIGRVVRTRATRQRQQGDEQQDKAQTPNHGHSSKGKA